MFNEILIIDRLKAQLPSYDILYSEDRAFDTAINLISPKVYVGHVKLVPRNSSEVDLIADGYSGLDRPLMLITSLMIVCERAKLAETRNAVYNALKDFNPVPAQGDYSMVMFLEAQMTQVSGPLAWWTEFIGTGVPRIA